MPRIRLIVPPEQAGERLDRALAALATLSRRHARELIRDAAVQRNGRLLQVESRRLDLADVLDLEVAADEVAARPLPDLPPIVFVHRDGWLIALDKPAGVLSQPASGRANSELAMDEALALHLAAAAGRPAFIRLVHRLDRVTSGLLLFAAHPGALRPLARSWRDGLVERTYLAVVQGEPGFEKELVEAPIGRSPAGAWRFEVSLRGRPARTRFERLHTGDGFAVVRCRLLTGRTHQVRVHLAHLGLPVLGDRLYGGAGDLAPRPLLHAAHLRFPHPRTADPLEIEAPLPADFAPFLPPSLIRDSEPGNGDSDCASAAVE